MTPQHRQHNEGTANLQHFKVCVTFCRLRNTYNIFKVFATLAKSLKTFILYNALQHPQHFDNNTVIFLRLLQHLQPFFLKSATPGA